MSASEFFRKVAAEKGAVVCEHDCTGREIEVAMRAGRFFRDKRSGLGFVLRPGCWRRTAEDLIRIWTEVK